MRSAHSDDGSRARSTCQLRAVAWLPGCLVAVEVFLDRVDEVEGEFDHVKTEYLDADNDEDLADDDAE